VYIYIYSLIAYGVTARHSAKYVGILKCVHNVSNLVSHMWLRLQGALLPGNCVSICRK